MTSKTQAKGERDLFDQIQTADKKIRRKTRLLLPQIKNNTTLSYENIIFFAIGFVMSCIIAFSLGVEKGRQDIAGSRHGGQAGLRAQGSGFRAEGSGGKSNHTLSPQSHLSAVAGGLSKPANSNYIIQLAAFKKRQPAEEEVNKLRLEKYNANIKKSGAYYQLYIGDFEDKKSAQDVLNKLKARYKDSYIKSL